MKDRTTDMTTGSPVKHIILFAIPSLIGNVFQQVYNIADSIIVGRFVGANALAAVGASASITFLFFALCNGIGNGGGIVASQYYGAHDEKKVKNCIVNTGFIMMLVPIIFGLIGFISAPAFLRLLSTPENIIADSTTYVRFMCVGLLFVATYNYLSAMLRALGDSKSPLYFLIISTIVNVVLDITFVYFLGMGIKGAALATVIAQFTSAISCAIYAYKTNMYFRLKKEDFVISSKMAYKIVRLGVPMSLQFALIAISSMALQKVVNSYGTTVVAAFTATNRIEQFIHQPYMTLGAALSTFCGQNYGAKMYDRVLLGYKKGLIMMTVVRGVLTGVGDAFFALFNGIVEVIGRFTIPMLLTHYMGMGAKGIWLSSGFVWVISGVTAWMRYYNRLHSSTFQVDKGTEPKIDKTINAKPLHTKSFKSNSLKAM